MGISGLFFKLVNGAGKRWLMRRFLTFFELSEKKKQRATGESAERDVTTGLDEIPEWGG